jgi:3'-5' exoribonuclease
MNGNSMKHKNRYVADLRAGQTIDDIFALAGARKNQAKNGPYWQLTLQDRTGAVEGRIWSPQSLQYEDLCPEQFVRVQGQVNSFKDQLQVNITSLNVLDPITAGIDLGQFLPVSAVPPEELLEELETILRRELTFPGWKKFCRRVLRDEDIRAVLLNAPGGKSMHHAYCGGLLEHTLGVVRACLAMSDLYPQLDREILLSAAAFHDIGKAYEISAGISREYTDAGKLLGHIAIGLELLAPHLAREKDLPPELVLHFKHLLLSHHGEYEYGSPKRPKTLEALVLHMADNLDAKANTFDSAFSEEEAGEGTWSGYQKALGRFLYLPPKTPAASPRPRRTVQKKEDQCLLPLKE